MNRFYEVAALAVLAGSFLSHAKADGSPAALAPSCEVGERGNTMDLSPDLLALSGAIYKKLCREIGGALVYSGDSTLEKRLTAPAGFSRSTYGFYPPSEIAYHHEGSTLLTIIVEADGRISWAAVLKSSGHPKLDEAAMKWAMGTSYKTPAYLDSKPVRAYAIIQVQFHTDGPR